jgi:hypothetical protein
MIKDNRIIFSLFDSLHTATLLTRASIYSAPLGASDNVNHVECHIPPVDFYHLLPPALLLEDPSRGVEAVCDTGSES